MIGSRVSIEAGTIVLLGVVMGGDVIIGAGGVVARDIQSNSIVAGNPARVLCLTVEYMEKRKEEMNAAPFLDGSYTLRGVVSNEMKSEMSEKIKDRVGYVI